MTDDCGSLTGANRAGFSVKRGFLWRWGSSARDGPTKGAARGKAPSANGLEKKLRPRRRNGSSLPDRRRRRKPLRHASRRGRG
jgi:hypothetical protein